MSKEIWCDASRIVPACVSCSAYRSSIFQGGHATCNRTKRLSGTTVIFVKIGDYRNQLGVVRFISVSESLSLRTL